MVSDADRFAARLEAVDAAFSKVADLRADFEQVRHTPLLKKPLTSKGVVLSKGDFVRWDTVSPRTSTLLIGQGSVRIYYPVDKLVEVYPVGEGFSELAGGPLPRLSVLKARFDISQIEPRELGFNNTDANLLALELTPKNEVTRKHVTAIKVLIDESRPAATKIIMTDPDGEVTEIVFSQIKVNSGVEGREINLQLPEDVRISQPLGAVKVGTTDPARDNVMPESTAKVRESAP